MIQMIRHKGSIRSFMGIIFTVAAFTCCAAAELHEAVIQNSRDKITALLAGGADVNEKNADGLTPLHYAAAIGLLPVAKLLLEKGADVNAVDNRKVTPLFFATQEGHAEIVKLLIAHKADVNLQHMHGASPLHVTALDGRVAIARDLINAGANPKLTNNSDETPLMVAAAVGDERSAVAFSKLIKDVDNYVSAANEVISFDDLRLRFNGGKINRGRVWSTSDQTIKAMGYDVKAAEAKPIELTGSWTMGNLLFLGSAAVHPNAIELGKGTVIFYPNLDVAKSFPTNDPEPVFEQKTAAEPVSAAVAPAPPAPKTQTTQAFAAPPAPKPHPTQAFAAPAAPAPPVPSASAKSDGFRVQIHAASTQSSAQRVKSQAEELFAGDNVNVYVAQESSLYKIRVGDCTSRHECENLMHKARQKGFAKAWIVATEIYSR